MSSPVSRETFLQEASFYSALSMMHPDDKIVLIRLPNELGASDLDGQILESFENETQVDERMIGSLKVFKKSKAHSSSTTETSYSVTRSNRNLKVNSVAMMQPAKTANLSLASAQQMQLGKAFDQFWSVNLGVNVDSVPIKRISKVVKKRAETPLVEQPRNLRIRLLPFSTPSSSSRMN